MLDELSELLDGRFFYVDDKIKAQMIYEKICKNIASSAHQLEVSVWIVTNIISIPVMMLFPLN